MKITEKIWKFIEKNKFLIFFMIITALSLVARGVMLQYISDDYIDFLQPWSEELKNNRWSFCFEQRYW